MTPAEWAAILLYSAQWPLAPGDPWFPEPTDAEIAAAMAIIGKVRDVLEDSENALLGLNSTPAVRTASD